jgi:hypothetical protein
MGKSALKDVIASKNGVFAVFAWQSFNDDGDCFDPVRENHRTGLADKCHCEQKRSFRPFLRGNLSTMMEIASTQCGKTTAPGLAMTEGLCNAPGYAEIRA